MARQNKDKSLDVNKTNLVESEKDKSPEKDAELNIEEGMEGESETDIISASEIINEKENVVNLDSTASEIELGEDISPEDVKSKSFIKLISALSYILFFLPLIFCKKEPFALYHANQSLIFWILMVALYLIFGFIPTVNLIALPIIILFNVLGMLYGMYNSATGKAKPFFLIGKITLIKWNNV